MYLIIYLNAGYSRKGNPRKFYNVYHFSGEILRLVDVIEEGYEATNQLKEKYPNYHLVDSFEIKAQEYKRLINENRNLHRKLNK